MIQAELERFRAAAARWRDEAEKAGTAEERRNCLVIADGYERLVEIWLALPEKPEEGA
ncbi:MAG: hypothetical protein J0H19_25435 [Rhodospirillales bacterium]|nr:hypothetical protein [Rhodospirillales bacterium]MBN8908654.1 hypothetical protein [Rhodospirillales bacterium]MBN8929949.1 hypothetical protein [Rhodospirillales bacterium]